MEQAYAEVRAYVVDLLERRRREPGEDLASVLTHAEEAISDDEAAILVSPAGGDGAVRLLHHGEPRPAGV